jgi:DNA-binding response OmpR family regulator
VDDDPDQVSLLSRFLSLHGIEAVPAYSGPQCLQLVQQRTIDVIVLNVEMPQMNGLEVCRTLKKQKASRAIPIIILTARDDPKTQRTALKRGASKFVSKPARGQEVLACIRAQLEKSRKET